MAKLQRIVLAGALFAMASTASTAGDLGTGGLTAGAGAITAFPPTLMTPPEAIVADGYIVNNNAEGSLENTVGWVANGPVQTSPANGSPITIKFENGAGYSLTFTGAVSEVYGPSSIGTGTLLGIVYTGRVSLVDSTGTHTGIGSLSFTYNQFDADPSQPDAVRSIAGGLNLQVTSIPEPGSMVLAGIGLAATGPLGLRKRRSR